LGAPAGFINPILSKGIGRKPRESSTRGSAGLRLKVLKKRRDPNPNEKRGVLNNEALPVPRK